MPDLQEALVRAIGTYVDNAVSKLEFDKTIECTIVRPVDSSTGEYKVRYLNGTFSAYDDTLKMSYREGQNVYVQIPKNNKSAKKLILGRKTTNASELLDATQDSERVELLGIPIDKIYRFDDDFNQEYGIYGSIEEVGYHRIFTHTPSVNGDTQLKNYAKDKKYLFIQADFKTDWYIPNAVESGNYGLEIYFNDISGQLMSPFILNRKNMSGDSMNYSNWITNYAIIEIDGNMIGSLNHVCFYSNTFKRNDGLSEDDLKAKYNEGKNPELFIRNILIQFCDIKDLTGYSVTINCPDGCYFDDKQNLRLQAILKYNGSTNGILQSKAEFYWYERDARVNILNENYDEKAGVGWKRIKEINKDLLAVSRDSFTSGNILQKIYKVVVFYNQNKATAETTIFRSSTDVSVYEIQLYKSADGRTGDLIVTPQTSNYTTTWLSIDSNGVDQAEESDEPFVLRGIDIANIVNYKTYLCTIINGDVPVYTIETIVRNEINVKDFDVEFQVDNNGIFYYDENGDLDSTLTGTSAFNIDFTLVGLDVSFPYEYEWKYGQTTDIDNKMFTITSTSLSGNQSKENKAISFTVERRFSREAAEDNIIELQIVADGITYHFYRTLEFIKQGDPGTNGTSLIMDVRLPGQNRAILADGRTQSAIPIQIQMYYNGRPQYAGVNVNNYFNFTCAIPDTYRLKNPISNSWTQNFTGTNSILNTTINLPAVTYSNANPNAIIQITAIPKTVNPFSYRVFYLMALPLTNTTTLQTANFIGSTIVQYDEQGYTPRFDESTLRLVDANGKVITETFTALGQVTIDSDKNVIVPPVYFDVKNHFMAVESTSKNYIQPIVAHINAYSKSALNSWDGAGIEIDENGSYILAAQMGAGKKENDNTFTGVLMGILDNPNSSSFTKQTGLMGFNHGISTFGLMSDGTAYIGASGEGRIILDGSRRATIQSGNYKASTNNDGEGTKIELSTGKIDSWNFTLKSKALTIDSPNNRFDFDINGLTTNSHYFRIRNDNTNLFYVGKTSNGGYNYYLQSQNYVEERTGLRINLVDGSLTSSQFRIDSGGNATFSGSLNAASGSFSGSLQAASGTFSGTVSAGTITGSTITGGSITSASISSGTITGGTISGASISGGSIDGVSITGGTISGAKFKNNSALESDSRADFLVTTDGELYAAGIHLRVIDGGVTLNNGYIGLKDSAEDGDSNVLSLRAPIIGLYAGQHIYVDATKLELDPKCELHLDNPSNHNLVAVFG